MIAPIVTWAVHKRWLVLLLTAIAAVIGAAALSRLPIDAVPDITNNQVQINVRAPALSPELVEKQVAFPIETALAGIPGLEYSRSLSRNGFAQVTAVFSDQTDIFFARQQVGERLTGVSENLPDGVTPEMGPIATGLGEVYMWTVRLEHRKDDKHQPGEPGMQPDGSYITPEGERLTNDTDKATYLRTAQDWIVSPLLKNTQGLAGVDSIGGYAKQFLVVPDVQKLASLGITLTDLGNALERNNTSVGGGFVNRNGEGLAVRSDALVRNASELARTVIATRNGVPITVEFTVFGIPCLGLNGGPHFPQTQAFSFQIATDDQAETDRLWNAIVGNGGQESACGWCKDKWGLSWQITPRVLTDAMAHPDRSVARRAFEAMMTMGKIDVARIEAAVRG